MCIVNYLKPETTLEVPTQIAYVAETMSVLDKIMMTWSVMC